VTPKDASGGVTAVKGSPTLMKKPVPPARPVSGNSASLVKAVSLRDELLAALQKSASAESVALAQQIKDGHTEVMLKQSEKLLTNLSMAVGVLNSASGFMARFSDAMGPFSSVCSGVTLILDVGLGIVKMVQSVHANHQQCRILGKWRCQV
jgi:hypothetical protein